MHELRVPRLTRFVEWARDHITGDEKGEAQVFLDRLLQAFGQPGLLEVGGKAEFRIKPASDDAGGTRFADYVWRPVVLVEMKKRGADLAKHAAQAFSYWTTLAPGRPRYVVLCNFDEFWIYDPEDSIYEPADKLRLTELPDRYDPLAFLFPTREPPKFKVNRLAVTRLAADHLAACFNSLTQTARRIPRDEAQRFILQILVALFSEDIGLLPKHFVTTLLDECTDPPTTFDLLGGLFTAMNTPGGRAGGRFREVAYFNGGLFTHPAPLELNAAEIQHLRTAAREYDWSQVSPDIFGTIFEHSLGRDDRHAFGAHYTSQEDILKIVRPTLNDPFTTLIQHASTQKELNTVRNRLQSLRVLDPACGSGNFLYVAYREMRRLEVEINRKEVELSRKQVIGQTALGGVSPAQFFGLDILPFAVELAKVTLAIAPKLAADELHTHDKPLPLVNLDDNIVARDALIDPDGSPARWPAADIIIGNPPFLGAKRLKPEHGADYVNRIRRAYPDVPGMADYCVYWFRKAHDHLPVCTPDNPTRGRAGLVGTQNIRNNQSRVGGLDHIVKSGVIVEAVENQPWSGEANVHVAIANWVKTSAPQPEELKEDSRAHVRRRRTTPPDSPTKLADPAGIEERDLLIPSPRKLWSKVDGHPELFAKQPDPARRRVMTTGKRGKALKGKSYELVARHAEALSSALSDCTDLSRSGRLTCNTDPQRVFQGFTPGYMGFVLSPQAAKKLASDQRTNPRVIRPYFIGRELAGASMKPSRFIIDVDGFDGVSLLELGPIYEHLKAEVLPKVMDAIAREENKSSDMVDARREHLERWWTFWAQRKELRSWMSNHARILACSRTQREPFIFVFISTTIAPGDKLQLFAFDDDYSFGIIQSKPHGDWYSAKGAPLKVETDINYSTRSVFDTFPWPQSPSKKQIRAVAAAGREIRRIRAEALPKVKGGLRALYRTLELPGQNPLKDAHAALDAAVLEAYGFSARKDLLKQLLDLNLAVAARIEKDGVKSVTAPGVPPSYGDPADLITEDCITP